MMPQEADLLTSHGRGSPRRSPPPLLLSLALLALCPLRCTSTTGDCGALLAGRARLGGAQGTKAPPARPEAAFLLPHARPPPAAARRAPWLAAALCRERASRSPIPAVMPCAAARAAPQHVHRRSTDTALSAHKKSETALGISPAGMSGGGPVEVEYSNSWLDRLLQYFLTEKIVECVRRTERQLAAGAVPDKRSEEQFSAFVDAAFLLNARSGKESQALTLQLLRSVIPAWFIPAFRGFLRLFPLWFDARHAAVSTVLLTPWLVGPARIIDVDPEVLDADEGPCGRGAGWGNGIRGWVPGFAMGGNWRAERGAGQGVLIEKCRVLEEAGCASVCVNVCKGPTQRLFTEDIGLPLTMVPDYDTHECRFYFGATPPPLERDEATKHGCLSNCRVVTGNAKPSDREVKVPAQCKTLRD